METTKIQEEWHFPTHIFLEAGGIRNLQNRLTDYGIKSAMVITDRNLTNSTILQKLLRRLDKTSFNFGVFSELDGVPCAPTIERGALLYQDGGFQAIIAFGSGDTIDLAKLIAWRTAQPVENSKLFQSISQPKIITIPTVAGSGAEVTDSAYFMHQNEKAGKYVKKPLMRPHLALLDPKLTACAPPRTTAAATMITFTQAFEAWCINSFNPIADSLAITAMRLVFTHLPRAIQNPSDLETQKQLLAASITGALAAQKGHGLTPLLAHALCRHLPIEFGMANAILLPYVVTFYTSAIEERILELCDALDIKNGFLRALLKLRRMAHIPPRLNELTIESKTKPITLKLLNKIHFDKNITACAPRKATKADLREIVSSAYYGTYNKTPRPKGEAQKK